MFFFFGINRSSKKKFTPQGSQHVTKNTNGNFSSKEISLYQVSMTCYRAENIKKALNCGRSHS